MKTIIAIASLALTACATPPPRPVTQWDAQCKYEATVAAAGIQNPFTAMIQKSKMFDMCVQLKSAPPVALR